MSNTMQRIGAGIVETDKAKVEEYQMSVRRAKATMQILDNTERIVRDLDKINTTIEELVARFRAMKKEA